MFSRDFFKATGCFTVGSVLMCSFAPAKTAFSVGISKERKDSFIKALDVIHKWVLSCYKAKGFNDDDYDIKEINSLYNDIKNLLNLTFKRCKEYETWLKESNEILDKFEELKKYYKEAKKKNAKKAMLAISLKLKSCQEEYENKSKEKKDIVFALAVQKTFYDLLKGLIVNKGEIVSSNVIGNVNGELSPKFTSAVRDKIEKIWILCKVCKDILESKNFDYNLVDKKAEMLRNLRFSLGFWSPEDKNIEDTKKYIDEINKEFGESGYDHEDDSLLEKVCGDLFYVESVLQCSDTHSKFAYETYKKISKFENHFNIDSKLKLEAEHNNIMHLYPFFISLIIKNEINKIFGFDCVGGLFRFLIKINKDLFKQPINTNLPKDLQKQQIKENEELKNAQLENKKNILKCNIGKFLSEEEQEKLNKALEPSVYEFSTPYIHMPGLMSQ